MGNFLVTLKGMCSSELLHKLAVLQAPYTHGILVAMFTGNNCYNWTVTDVLGDCMLMSKATIA